MAKQETSLQLLSPVGSVRCHECGTPMKQISWKITAGAHDAGKEVQQFVYACPEDRNTTTVEMTTGNPSEFAMVDESYLEE